MNYANELLNYMNLLDCNTNDICKESGLSYSLVNRYLNGRRTPKPDSEYFNKIVDSLYNISVKKGKDFSRELIQQTLTNSLNCATINIDLFTDKFNFLQNALSLKTSEISKALGYDSSFISRMKIKERKPADIDAFIDKFCNYIISVCKNKNANEIMANILKCSVEDLESQDTFSKIFLEWLRSENMMNNQSDVLTFLKKLDDFNLSDYINADFNKIKVPQLPVIFKNSKVYYGIEGRKQAEGEFLKTTLLAKSNESIFFYSDLPVSQAGEDEDFKEKWVYAMSVLLKRGLHLNMIHNLDRPVNELLLGLENWIPIYMSGSISPYYFKTAPSNFFNISQCTSGSIALSGECIKHNEKKSQFYLTTKKAEVAYEKEKSRYMLSQATPLMKIYKEDDENEFNKFLNEAQGTNIKKIKKDIFKNIDFCINENNWIIINKEISPKIHFVIFNEKLIEALKIFLLS